MGTGVTIPPEAWVIEGEGLTVYPGLIDALSNLGLEAPAPEAEEALKGVTLYPAKILGVDDQLGTLEVGKLANLIVTDGDPLDIQTRVRYLFINGQLTSTDNKHRQLYERYRRRP